MNATSWNRNGLPNVPSLEMQFSSGAVELTVPQFDTWEGSPVNSASVTPFRIISVDKLTNGLVLRFEDGRSVLFSAELLYSMIGSALVLAAE